MFGRLSQLAQNVQNSFNADESEGSPSKGLSDTEKTIARLQADLEQAEEQNRSINSAFKKLLKEKEQEIRTIKEQALARDPSVGDSNVQGDKNADLELINQLKRKNEEYKMLVDKKDETIQMLMANVKEAEDLKDKVEQQERINTEKLMFELAERIRAHENIQRKLEETTHVMTEKDNAIHNMADQMAAQDELLKAKDESIKKLKRMAAGNETSEDMIVTLQKALQEKDNRLSQMAQLVDKLEVEKKVLDGKINNRDGLETSKDQTIKTLWSEIEQKNEIIQKISSEKEELLSTIHRKEEELKSKMDLINEKETVVDDLALKVHSLEKELNVKHSDIEVSSEGASREIGHLKDQLAELNEILKSKTQTIDMFQKEIEEKDSVHFDLRQKALALQKVVEDKDDELLEMSHSNKKLIKERDESKEIFEKQETEKRTLKEELDKVGRELSQQLDEEAQKVSELMSKLSESEDERTRIKKEMDNLVKDLAICKESQTATLVELDSEKSKMNELKKSVGDFEKEAADRSEELVRMKHDLESAGQELKTKNEELDLRNKEMHTQRERFDAELHFLQSTSESEKGNVANLLKEMEQVRRDLDTATQERRHFESETIALKRDLEDREEKLEKLQQNVNKSFEDNSKLKEVVSLLEGRIEELNNVEKLNESLRADNAKELERMEEAMQISVDLGKECDKMKKDVEDKCLALEEKQSYLQKLEEENLSLKEEGKKLGQQLEDLLQEKKSIKSENEEMKKQDENLNAKLSSMKNEYLGLNEKVTEMEEALNHMVEKLNTAELKMNESLQEKEAVEAQLKQIVEERSMLASQKSDIETALEEFVRSTESRKKRSGRSSVDGSEGARSSPNEGLSGYSTPVSKEGSPRNSAFLDTFQPTLQTQVTVGNLFEGKAISEIFRLVEEERKALETNLASANKDKDTIAARNSDLEDYLDLERQKFKQASEEISLLQQKFADTEDDLNQHIHGLKEELLALRYANDELGLRVQQDSEVLDGNRQQIEQLESSLRRTEDHLAEKALELTRLTEISDQMQTELGNKEDQLEKTAKQNKQLKIKLKEILKERTEREKSAHEKEARIAELEPLSDKLNESLSQLGKLEIEVNERDNKIETLEQERSDRTLELAALEAKISDLEENAHRLREMSAQEVYVANEKATELERSFRELEDINKALKGDVGTKAHEIEDLGSILSVHKEELMSLKGMLLHKDEEIAMMRGNVDMREQSVNELTKELDQERSELKAARDNVESLKSSLVEKEDAITALGIEVAEKSASLVEGKKEFDALNCQNLNQSEYISKLEGNVKEIDSELLSKQKELAHSEETNQAMVNKVNSLEQEMIALRGHITERDDNISKILAENEKSMLQKEDNLNEKEKEVLSLVNQTESLQSKLKDLEVLLLDKDEGLRDIVNLKNSEVELLRDEKQALSHELLDAKRSIADYQQRLVAAENDLEGSSLKLKKLETDLTGQIADKEADISQKADEIVNLTGKCSEGALLLEDMQKQLKSAKESLGHVAEVNNTQRRELEEKNGECLSLERALENIKTEKLNLVKDLEVKEGEVDQLKKQVASTSEKVQNLTEELVMEKRAFEEQKSIMEQNKDDSGSQIENLLTKINELIQEKNDLLKSTNSLQLDLETRGKALSEADRRMEQIIAEKDELKQQLDGVCLQLVEKKKELDDKLVKLQTSEENNKRILNDNIQLAGKISSCEEQMRSFEIQSIDSVKSLNADISVKEEVLATVKAELEDIKEKEKNLSNLTIELETTISGKDKELRMLKEEVSRIDKLQRDLEESYKENELLGARHEKAIEKSDNLEKEIEALQKEIERSDKEFEAERDIFASRISGLSADIEKLSKKEIESRLELERVQKEANSKDELITLKSEELEVSKSMTERLEKEEILKLQEEVSEKNKNFEEYKSRVLKKMKSMKEELKKLNARNDELSGKEALLSKIKSELENQESERFHMQSNLSEMESELKTVKQERQDLEIQLQSHRQKIVEMENFNVSREENMRNFETELVRYQRLLRDKDEEGRAVKELMQNSMEEMQTLRDQLDKKEERVKILQEQLMANEEDFVTSFSEKEKDIEELKEKLREVESSFIEKEKASLDLMKNIECLEEEAVQLKSRCHDMNLELQAAKEEKGNAAGENSMLLEKVDMLVAQIEEVAIEKDAREEEILRVREELAVATNDVSLKNEEIQQLHGEISKITVEHMQNSSKEELTYTSEEYATLKNEKDNLQRSLDNVAEKNRLLEMECKEKGAEIDLLVEQLQERSDDVERLRSKEDVNLEQVIRPYVEQISELQDATEKKKRGFDEYKAKVAKRIKALKEENTSVKSMNDELNRQLEEQAINSSESFLGLEKENESMNSRIAELQQALNVSVKDVEEFQLIAKATQEDADSARHELGKIKQRLSDKEEEIMTVKDMMRVTMNEMQTLQEDLIKKEEEIDKFRTTEDSLSSSMVSLKEELASMKEEYRMKTVDHKTMEDELLEKSKQIEVLSGELAARNTDLDQLKISLAERSGDVISDVRIKEDQIAELEKESEGVKLKLAKAIKRISTMKKELQSREELLKNRDGEIAILRRSMEELKELTEQLKCEVDEAKGKIASQAEELQTKGVLLTESSPKTSYEVKVEEMIVPSTIVSVAAEHKDVLGDVSSAEGGDLGPEGSQEDLEVVNIAEESVHPEANCDGSTGKNQGQEIEVLKKKRDELSESLKKSTEQVEKARKKLTALKKVDMKRGKELEELRVTLRDLSAQKEDEICKLTERINDLNHKLNEKEEQVSSLTQTSLSVSSDLEEAVKLKDKIQTTNEDLKKLVEVMAEEKHELDDEMKDMLGEIKDVMNIKNKLLMDLREMKEELERKDEECCQLREMLREREENLAANEWKMQESESLETDLADSMHERNRLDEELTANAAKLGGLEDILKTRENEICNLKEEILKMRDCDVIKEGLISELQCEISEKDNVLKELPNQEGIALLHHKIGNLEEDLKLKQDDLIALKATNEELTRALGEEKATIRRLQEEYLAEQSDLATQSKSYLLRIGEYEAEVNRLQEKMTLSLEQIEKMEMLESLNAELQQELDKQTRMVSEHDKIIAEKNDEIKTLNLMVQEKEKEVGNLSIQIASERKQTEILNESERSLLQSTIDELRQDKSQSEGSLHEEIRLLKDRLNKESEIINEKSRIEHDELVKSFEQKSQTLDELASNVDKLNETIEHKDTVIAKLKLKLKHTIKDRDVMKGNLQSEIERISQEKDVVFNEFQTKVQQTEDDMQNLKNELVAMEKQHEEMKIEKDGIVRSLEERLRVLSVESDEEKAMNVEACSKMSALEREIAALRQELGEKEEVIEKYEWENSEKEDKIRALERDARFFEGRKAEWEELKQTFEDTIDVKERIMEKLQKEIEENQSEKVMFSKAKEAEIRESEERNNDIENDLKARETRIREIEEELVSSKLKVSEFVEAKQKIFELLGEDDIDVTNEKDIFSIMVEFKTNFEKIINAKEEELHRLDQEIKSLIRDKSDFEKEAKKFKEEVEFEMQRVLHYLDGEQQLAEDGSLKNNIELIISKIDVCKNQNMELENSLTSLKESTAGVDVQLREFPGSDENDAGILEVEREGLQQSQYTQEGIAVMSDTDSQRELKELQNETLHLKEELSRRRDIIENHKHENARLEKRASDMEHMLDLAKLETQQVTIDKENIERQLEILVEESESFRSSTLPEMQTLLSTKNKTMLELRENFSEVISDKDSIIVTLRAKIGELQQSLSAGNFQSQGEIDALKGLVSQRDELLARLERDLASAKRSRDLLESELSKTITEKDSIGGSIQDQFENISKGLRGDIELFMEDKRAFEMEFQLERLQLERSIAEQRSEIDDLRKDISAKDKEVYELNFVVAELRRRVENAADILSKEDYYHQLEERIEASHEDVRRANAAVRDVQDSLREEKARVEELEMRLDISNREKGEVVLVYEGKIHKIKNDHSKAYESLNFELQETISKNAELESSLESRVEEASRNYQFEEQQLREIFGKERVELIHRTEELVKDVERLEKEKIVAMEEAISKVLTNADDKMLRLKDDYENIVADKNYRIKEFADRIEYMQERLDSLSESNTNLSKNLFMLENDNMDLRKEATSLSNIYQQAVANHKKEIENLLVKKGKEFKSLRSQFEDALEEKEKILENLREKLKGLHEELEFRFQENNELNSEKEGLLQESIRKDLMYEKLKINVDSLLSSVFEISRARNELQKFGENEKIEERDDMQDSDRGRALKLGENITKDGTAKGFEAAMSQAKVIVDSYILSKKDIASAEEHLEDENSKLRTELKIMEEENSRLSRIVESSDEANEKRFVQQGMERESLENHVRNLETDNAKLQAIIAQFDSNSNLNVVPGKKKLNVRIDERDEAGEEDEEQESVRKPVDEDITPVSYVELQAEDEEEHSKREMLVSMKEELALLKAENERLEKTRNEMELSVRGDFDDILQNLRMDLQNALNENKSLMNENFMLKNIRTEKESEESVKNDVTCQTGDLEASDSLKVSSSQSHMVERGSSLEAFAQTDVSFVHQTLEDSNRDAGLGEAVRIKRYSSSDRLPEVVEDSLYSKMSFENHQTFSDSTLDVESLTGHAKLELRLGEDTEDGDRYVNVADMQNEVERLISKLQQSKRMILKLKQMTKKYKTELSELQAEKFEQVRVYEEAVTATKQELEESNLEKVRKDQDIRSLREEVRLLVKEKADFGDAIKARIDGIVADHSKAIAELTEAKDRECAYKDEVIKKLYNWKSESESKIEQLTNQLNHASIDRDTLRTDNERTNSMLHEEISKAVEKSTEFEGLKARFQDMEMKLIQTEEKRDKLAEKLNVAKSDAMVDNARFDDEIIERYAEEFDRTNVELKEAFDLIRALENNQRDLEDEIESRTNELNTIIDTHELTIERMTSEKIEVEKSMQEMREVVKQVIEEKDSLVGHWKNENSRIIEENEKKFSENVEVSQRNVEECQAEILALRGQVDAQVAEIESLKEHLNTAETSAREFAQKTDGCEVLVADLRSELGHVLEEKSLLEDKIEFFDHHVNALREDHVKELQTQQGDIEKLDVVVQDMRIALHEKDQTIGQLESERQSLSDEINKGKKKIKRWKKELETSKKRNQELADAIRVEMEQVLSEIHDEKASLYSDVLSKDKQLQELRIHADHLVHEKEQWNSRIRASGPIESDVLVGNAVSDKVGFTDERLGMQVNQLKAEKEEIVAGLESKLLQLKRDYDVMEKRKRAGDLKTAELQARIDHLLKQDPARGKSGHSDKLESYQSEVRGLKGDIELLKQEASGLAGSSKMLFGQMEKEITSLLMGATHSKLQPAPPTVSSVGSTGLVNLSPTHERLSDNSSELEEAKEQIAMLEDSLQTWKERCSELEEQLEQGMIGEATGRRGSREFLINIDDEGPSIETARPTFGEKARRLTKYSTSGISFKTRARSFFSSFMSKQRGMLPVRRIFLMVYIMAVHILAFMSLYGLLHG